VQKTWSKILSVLLFSCALLAQAASTQSNADPATKPGKALSNAPADAPRVFITDSESWSVAGSSGGSGGSYGGAMAGGARPQTAEIIKTFGERCPEVKVNNKQDKADYIVVLDHEGGKGFLRHRNKVAVFNKVTGDSVMSKSTLSLGGSVQEACDAIARDWSAQGESTRGSQAIAKEKVSPAANPVAPPPVAVAAPTAKLQIDSIPPGADIEVDGSFVGNTPSTVQVTEGDHLVVLRKGGYENWERKLKASAGSEVRVTAELKKNDVQ
jgi:hypothetical protein